MLLYTILYIILQLLVCVLILQKVHMEKDFNCQSVSINIRIAYK